MTSEEVPKERGLGWAPCTHVWKGLIKSFWTRENNGANNGMPSLNEINGHI